MRRDWSRGDAEQDLLRFCVNREQDPSGRGLHALLAAHIARERLQAVSLRLLYGLLSVGAVVWVAAVAPSLLPSWLAQSSELAWGIGFFVLIIVLVKKRLCGFGARRLADESLEPPTSRASENGPD